MLNYKVYTEWLLYLSLSHKQLSCFLWALEMKADSGAQKTNNESYYSGVIILPIPILSAQTMHYRKEITTDSVV